MKTKNKKITRSGSDGEQNQGEAPVDFLSAIESPDDLKKLTDGDIPALCRQIREKLIETVPVTGGHLASNLGIVEITVAMHRVFDCPRDHFIFDVGHQSYVHKMLTGRYRMMPGLRQGGGISGFTKRSESPYDCFGAGHSSTSVSAGLGFCEGDSLSGNQAYTVVVLGDGAFTGGMIHEALNNIRRGRRLIIILNENEMSISPNIGRFATQLARLRTSHGYFRLKKTTTRVVRHIPFIGPWLFAKIRDMKKNVKNRLYGSNYFEDMGLFYLGPADGNDYETVAFLMNEAKKVKDNVIIHLKTKKGLGYPPAEANPGAYHSIPPMSAAPVGINFSKEMGAVLTELARQDGKICAITAGMSYGTGLETFRREIPERFFDVGIAEEHALTFAAGLAADGYKPVLAIYSTFLQRGYDQLIHDIALQKLPVVLCIDRAGLSGSDGPTHHGVFDVAFLSHIPDMTVYTPLTFDGLKRSLEHALALPGPSAIRYGNSGEDDVIKERFYKNLPAGDVGVVCDFDASGPDGDRPEAIVICHGRMVGETVRAQSILAAKGIRIGIVAAEYIMPYAKLAREICGLGLPSVPVVFVEEEIRAGGFGMNLSDALKREGRLRDGMYACIGTEDPFVTREAGKSILQSAHVDADTVAETVIRLTGRA